MNHRFPDMESIRTELEEPFPSGRMAPGELGDVLARLVWESFSDFLADPEHASARTLLGLDSEASVPEERVAEELLIFHLWAHSRAVQLSFVDRIAPDSIRAILDRLHGAVFEDMVANGTPRSQVPVFEQRVSARYAEFYAAADRSDSAVGRAVLDHLVTLEPIHAEEASIAMRNRAIEVTKPLRDYLDGVEVSEVFVSASEPRRPQALRDRETNGSGD